MPMLIRGNARSTRPVEAGDDDAMGRVCTSHDEGFCRRLGQSHQRHPVFFSDVAASQTVGCNFSLPQTPEPPNRNRGVFSRENVRP